MLCEPYIALVLLGLMAGCQADEIATDKFIHNYIPDKIFLVFDKGTVIISIPMYFN